MVSNSVHFIFTFPFHFSLVQMWFVQKPPTESYIYILNSNYNDMLNERVECLWYFYGHTELWNPAHRNESYACIDFNFDRLEIKQTTKLGRLHARVNTHPRSVKYNFINVHLMLSIFKQLSRTKKQHQKKWIKENVDWNANSVGCTTPNANVQCSTSIQNNRLSYFIATLFFSSVLSVDFPRFVCWACQFIA